MIDPRLLVVLSEAYRQREESSGRCAFDWIEALQEMAAALPPGALALDQIRVAAYRLAAASLIVLEEIETTDDAIAAVVD